MLSKEYTLAIVLLVGFVLKFFGIEIPNETVEEIVGAVLALFIAVFRYAKGDINLAGVKNPVLRD